MTALRSGDALVVVAEAELGVVVVAQRRFAVAFGQRRRDADRSPALCQPGLVFLRQVVAAGVEHGQAHDAKPQLQVAVLLDLKDPAGGDPRERADRVEVEVDLGGHGVLLCGVEGIGSPSQQTSPARRKVTRRRTIMWAAGRLLSQWSS